MTIRKDRGTVYECLSKSKEFLACADTEGEAIKFLEANGGGIYRNKLHGFDCRVDAKLRSFTSDGYYGPRLFGQPEDEFMARQHR